MEERVARILLEVVELVGEVKALRGEVAEERGEDAAGDARVLALVLLGLAVGLGHLGQGWWRWRRQRRQRGDEGGEALTEVVTIGRTEEAMVVPAVAGEGDLERVEVVREGGNVRGEGVEGRGGVVRGREWWDCLLVSRR